MTKKKLIEVALPLEKINAESAREKSIRHGHPSTLHLWWARRPLAAARAVIWSSLVDDPSSHPEEFPTEEAQDRERQRLFSILEKLVVWENSDNEEVLAAAKAEILKSTDGNLPALLDPFAGGGAIPLEAQRLGLEAHAHDLNPVAVMINKAMIEIPPKFAGNPPVNPEARQMELRKGYAGAQGLAEDVRYYGTWMKEEAFRRIGQLYPKVKVPREQGGGEATVIAWIWARTVKCPNPACGCEMPLASSFVLSKKKGKEAYIEPVTEGKNIRYVVRQGKCPKEKESVKLKKGASFRCVHCGAVTEKDYIHDEFIAKRAGARLMAIVAEGRNGRLYLSPDEEQERIAHSAEPAWEPEELMNTETPNLVSGRGYGITQWKELFTKRQLTALTTFSDLIAEAREKAETDARAAGLPDDGIPLSEGGSGAKAYGEAVSVYLAFAVDRLADICSSVASWINTLGAIRNTFGRQAIPMVWDYAEGNPFSTSTGCFNNMLEWVIKCVDLLPASFDGKAKQFDAQSDCGLRRIAVSTDPPYYDNIDYSDLSDFFYIWMRKALLETYPRLFNTLLVPKAEELVAMPHRHNGSMEAAKEFFEDGMFRTCRQIYTAAREDIPVTIYYAYKQSNTNEGGKASSGWETMLTSIVKAGFAITGTWPMRTERSVRTIAQSTNALASSIVLVCRKRPEDAPVTTRKRFINELKRELRPALEKLQESNIAPVDLAQSAIGPGMGIYSKYKAVLEADGSPMTVRSALSLINEELDFYFNAQDNELDRDSRFCVALYTDRAFNDVPFGTADTLARAKNTSVDAVSGRGVLYAQKGTVHLLEREALPEAFGVDGNMIWLLAQQLTRAMEKGGIEASAKIVSGIVGPDAEYAKSLAYRLYTLANAKGWAQEAYAYNSLVVAWPEILARAENLRGARMEEVSMF